MSEGRNKQLKESVESSDTWHCPYPFIVSAVLQKFGIKNANGRVYPENILRREVEKYQELIAERRALGECYKPDALILTEEGWKTLEDVKEGENVLTLNTDTNEIEVQPIYEKVEYDYDGDMIHIYNRNIDDIVTPNHEFLLFKEETEKFAERVTAEDIFNGNYNKHRYIPRKGKWIGRNDEYMIIPNLSEERISKMHSYIQNKYNDDLKIPMDLFAKFMGIYLSEGSCDNGEDGTRVMIYQQKQDVVDKIDELLKEIGLKYTKEEIVVSEKKKYVFVICDMRLCRYLQQFGLCYDKYVPFELKQQSSEVLKGFYDWFVLGDCRIRGDKRNGTILSDDVFSSSKQLILDLNEIQLKIGSCGNYHVEKRDNDRYIYDRLIEDKKNCHPLYFSLRSTIKKGVRLDKRFLKTEKIPYKGKVVCVKVKNHNFYVMCNNKTHWTSNYCNHPSDSTIDLGRISHNIIECHWEGNTLMGQLELNLSKGFVKHGICSTLGDTCANLLLNGYKIGISSRGVGSVEQKLGQYVVGDDLELISWDLVATPSTPRFVVRFFKRRITTIC